MADEPKWMRWVRRAEVSDDARTLLFDHCEEYEDDRTPIQKAYLRQHSKTLIGNPFFRFYVCLNFHSCPEAIRNVCPRYLVCREQYERMLC